MEDDEKSFVLDAGGGVALHVDKGGGRAPLAEVEPRLVFHTDGLSRRCTELRDLGVSVEGPRAAGERGHVAELTDPDGHPIVLWER